MTSLHAAPSGVPATPGSSPTRGVRPCARLVFWLALLAAAAVVRLTSWREVFGPDRFFETTDFISVGGNDLKQFFFAADRENELVRRRYEMLSTSFLDFLEQIVARCARHGTPLSFCGEDAGRPIEALALAAIGFRSLSMRPASIGPVKALIRKVDLAGARAAIDDARRAGQRSARPALEAWLAETGVPH